MRNIFIILIFFIYLFNRTKMSVGIILGLNLFYSSLFGILFPTFIINDLLLSTNLCKYINKYFGRLYSFIFGLPSILVYVSFISLLSGSPSNIKTLKYLYDYDLITNDELNKFISFNITFNPFFIIYFSSLRIFIIYTLSNVITGTLFRSFRYNNKFVRFNIINEFSLTDSIYNNLIIMLSIMGSICLFSGIINVFKSSNYYFNLFISGLLEITNGVNFVVRNNLSNFYLLLFMSFGGLSLLIQIKSILKDTRINYFYLFFTRLIVFIISCVLCLITS